MFVRTNQSFEPCLDQVRCVHHGFRKGNENGDTEKKDTPIATPLWTIAKHTENKRRLFFTEGELEAVLAINLQQMMKGRGTEYTERVRERERERERTRKLNFTRTVAQVQSKTRQ